MKGNRSDHHRDHHAVQRLHPAIEVESSSQREKTKGRDGGVFVPVYEGGESDGEVGRNGFSGGRGKASGTAGGGGGEARAGASQFLRSGGRFQNFEMAAVGRARVHFLVGEAPSVLGERYTVPDGGRA